MKKIKCFIALFGLISIFLVGCSNSSENEVKNIGVPKPVIDESKIEYPKEIKINNEQIIKVKEILDDIDWQNAKVDMVRPADYRFSFEFENPGTEAKTVLYELWISPNKDKVELVIDTESKYIQLDTDTSAELFKLIVGEELSDQI